jgi:hypothetical protein
MQHFHNVTVIAAPNQQCKKVQSSGDHPVHGLSVLQQKATHREFQKFWKLAWQAASSREYHWASCKTMFTLATCLAAASACRLEHKNMPRHQDSDCAAMMQFLSMNNHCCHDGTTCTPTP